MASPSRFLVLSTPSRASVSSPVADPSAEPIEIPVVQKTRRSSSATTNDSISSPRSSVDEGMPVDSKPRFLSNWNCYTMLDTSIGQDLTSLVSSRKALHDSVITKARLTVHHDGEWAFCGTTSEWSFVLLAAIQNAVSKAHNILALTVWLLPSMYRFHIHIKHHIPQSAPVSCRPACSFAPSPCKRHSRRWKRWGWTIPWSWRICTYFAKARQLHFSWPLVWT